MDNLTKDTKVRFGRPNGEQTLGKIIKVNGKSYKIEQLEERGVIRERPAGTVWTVSKSFVTLADPSATPNPGKQATISRLAGELASKVAWEAKNGKPARPESVILGEIRSLYSQLTPENLSCDGEIRGRALLARHGQVTRQLKACFAELGREVSEDEACGF